MKVVATALFLKAQLWAVLADWKTKERKCWWRPFAFLARPFIIFFFFHHKELFNDLFPVGTHNLLHNDPNKSSSYSIFRIGLCGFDNPMRDHKTDELKRHIGQVSCQSISLHFLFIKKKLLYNGNDAIVNEWVALPASHSIPLLFSIEFCMHVSLPLFLQHTLAYEHSILGLRLDTIFIHTKLVMNIHTHVHNQNISFNLGLQKWQIEKKSPLLAIGKFDDSVNSFKLIVLRVWFFVFFFFIHYYLNYLQIVKRKK